MAQKVLICGGCRTGRREKEWHLCCADCWDRLPQEHKTRVYRLFNTARRSADHRRACWDAMCWLTDPDNLPKAPTQEEATEAMYGPEELEFPEEKVQEIARRVTAGRGLSCAPESRSGVEPNKNREADGGDA